MPGRSQSGALIAQSAQRSALLSVLAPANWAKPNAAQRSASPNWIRVKRPELGAAHARAAVEALVASAVADRDVTAAVAHRRVAHHLAELLVEHALARGRGLRAAGAGVTHGLGRAV